MRVLKFNTKEIANQIGCEPALLYSEVCVQDNEISNDLSPNWVYTDAKIICSGILYKDEITIILAEEDDEEAFKKELTEKLSKLNKETQIFAFNKHMEAGNFKGFLGLDIPVQEIKPFFSKGFSKEKFFFLLNNNHLIPELNLQDKFNGDGGLCIPAWRDYKETGDIQYLMDIAQHNINCLIKECLILKNDKYFKENYVIDHKGWMLREKTEEKKDEGRTNTRN